MDITWKLEQGEVSLVSRTHCIVVIAGNPRRATSYEVANHHYEL